MITELNATTYQEVYPRVVEDEYFRNSASMAYIRDHCLVPFGGGAYTQFDFVYAPLIGGAYALGQNFNMTEVQIMSAAVFDAKYYEVAIPQYKEVTQVLNKGPLAIFSIIDTKLRVAMNTISSITGIALAQNGQGARSIEINGWTEAYNDGMTPDWQGNVWASYGTAARNGAIGTALNSTPLWFGNSDGTTAAIAYNQVEEAYQNCCRANVEPDLMIGNKAVYAYVKERMQVQQRFAQEKDPYWGVTGFRFNSAMFLKDDYFPSLKYGVNDPNLGDYLTGTFTMPSGAATMGGFPNSGVTINVGEVLGIFNTRKWMFRISDDPEYGYGFSGFLPAQDNTRVVGYIKAAQNLEIVAPWSGTHAYGIGA